MTVEKFRKGRRCPPGGAPGRVGTHAPGGACLPEPARSHSLSLSLFSLFLPQKTLIEGAIFKAGPCEPGYAQATPKAPCTLCEEGFYCPGGKLGKKTAVRLTGGGGGEGAEGAAAARAGPPRPSTTTPPTLTLFSRLSSLSPSLDPPVPRQHDDPHRRDGRVLGGRVRPNL